MASSPAPSGTLRTVVDSDPAQFRGHYNSLAVGADGYPVIAYLVGVLDDLWVAHCSNAACTAATKTSVDSSANNVGMYPSIAIGSDGLPIVSYKDFTSNNVWVAHCSDLACTAAIKTEIDNSADNVGRDTSIAIGSDGLAIVSYKNETTDSLWVAHCSNVLCTAATKVEVDNPSDNVGTSSSIAVGADGLPVISYHNAGSQSMWVAHCNDLTCSTSTKTNVASTGSAFANFHSSLVVGADGLPIISYHKAPGDLWVAHCSNVACTAATSSAVDGGANDRGAHNSIAVGSDGLAVISYHDETSGDLWLAHCSNLACTASTTTVVDSTPTDDGQVSTVAIGADGFPVISYFNNTNVNLKVAKCSNPFCVPHFFR